MKGADLDLLRGDLQEAPERGAQKAYRITYTPTSLPDKDHPLPGSGVILTMRAVGWVPFRDFFSQIVGSIVASEYVQEQGEWAAHRKRSGESCKAQGSPGGESCKAKGQGSGSSSSCSNMPIGSSGSAGPPTEALVGMARHAATSPRLRSAAQSGTC